jgi:hypothetical protein
MITKKMKKQPQEKEPDVYNRIIDGRGLPFVDDIYSQALLNSTHLSFNDRHKEFNEFWVDLKNSALTTPDHHALSDQDLEKRKRTLYKAWKIFRRPAKCKLHTGYLHIKTGYPSHSVRVGNKSAYLALHQMAARQAERPTNQIDTPDWSKTDSVASHTCQIKACLKCGIRESRAKNNLRTSCKCYIIVNGFLLHSCIHEPKCRKPGVNAFKK